VKRKLPQGTKNGKLKTKSLKLWKSMICGLGNAKTRKMAASILKMRPRKGCVP
jgi:hypothetical protein